MSEVTAKTIFKVIAVLGLVLCALMVVATGLLLPFNFFLLSPFIILSIGMFYLRQWAAVGISLLCCLYAFLFFTNAIAPFPGTPTWSGFIAGFLLMIPGVLTVTQWRVLVWRAKQDGR